MTYGFIQTTARVMSCHICRAWPVLSATRTPVGVGGALRPRVAPLGHFPLASDGVRTSGVVADVPRFPTVNGKMWGICGPSVKAPFVLTQPVWQPAIFTPPAAPGRRFSAPASAGAGCTRTQLAIHVAGHARLRPFSYATRCDRMQHDIASCFSDRPAPRFSLAGLTWSLYDVVTPATFAGTCRGHSRGRMAGTSTCLRFSSEKCGALQRPCAEGSRGYSPPVT